MSDNDFGVSVAQDGTLWIGSGRDLIRVDPAGVAWCHTESPGAVNSNVVVGWDNTVYYSRNDEEDSLFAFPDTIRALNPDGTSTIIAGGRGNGIPQNGAQATSSKLWVLLSLTAGPDGSLYFVNIDAAGHLGFFTNDKDFDKARIKCVKNHWGCG